MNIIDSSRNPSSTALLLFFCRHHVPLISKLFRLLHNSDIYCNLKGRDIQMPHPYGIIIHSKTVIGQHVTIMQQVTLGGSQVGINEAPVIEDFVYIGAGAKVLGNVRIGHHAVIGANAVITRDVPAGATVVGANRMIKTASEDKP